MICIIVCYLLTLSSSVYDRSEEYMVLRIPAVIRVQRVEIATVK